jgi:hypothetical protein
MLFAYERPLCDAARHPGQYHQPRPDHHPMLRNFDGRFAPEADVPKAHSFSEPQNSQPIAYNPSMLRRLFSCDRMRVNDT